MKTKKILKSILFIVLITALIVNSSTVIGFAVTDSGFCGKGVTWTFDAETGMLEITGIDGIYDYQSAADTPWYQYRELITDVEIENGVAYIGDNAFSGLSNLERINVVKSVIEVGENAFDGTAWLENSTEEFVTLNGVLIRYNGDNTEIELPEKVTGICSDAFRNNTEVTKVISDYSIICISDNGFANCTSLEEVCFASLEKLCDNVFNGCTSLRKIQLSDDVKFIGTSCFDGTAWLEESEEDFTRLSGFLIEYKGNGGIVTIPEGIVGITNAFIYNTDVETVYFPDSLECIGDYAFAGCESLSCVVFGNRVKKIGKLAFFDCFNINELFFPDSLEEIGENAFENCSSVMTVRFSDNLNTIGNYAFASCSSVESLILPDKLKTVGEYAFCNCDCLDYVYSDSRSTEYKTRALGYSILQSGISLNDALELSGEDSSSLHEYALNNHMDYNSISCNHQFSTSHCDAECDFFGYTLNECRRCGYYQIDNIEKPTEHSFSAWSDMNGYYERTCSLCRLKEYDRTVEYDGWSYSYTTDKLEIYGEISTDEIFETCKKNAIYLYLSDNGNVDFSDCGELKFACINGIETLTSAMFSNCKNLETVLLSDGLTEIEANCFSGCSSLDEIYLPNSVDNISETAFPSDTLIKHGLDISWKPDSDRFVLTGDYQTEYTNGFVNLMADEIAFSFEAKKSNKFSGNGAEFDFYTGKTKAASTVAVIYGDLNSDGQIDGMDAVIANILKSDMIFDDTTNGAIYKAADCNKDGTINTDDVSVIADCGVFVGEINQGGCFDD